MFPRLTTFSALAKVAATRRLGALGRDERGIAAVEAAFIFPVMVVVLALIVVFGQAFDIKRKVTQTTEQVTNLVALWPLASGNMQQSDIDGYLDMAALTMLPYSANGNTGNLSVVVTEFQANAAATTGTALWSEAQYGGVARAANTTITLPTGLVAPNGYVILGEVSWAYTPLNIGPFPLTTMSLHDSIFLSPRQHTCIATYSYHPGTCT